MKARKAKKKLQQRIEVWEKLTARMTPQQKMAYKKLGSLNPRKR